MTMFHSEVVKLQNIQRHPNADTLLICKVMGDYTVIFKDGQYKEGDLASYICEDSIVSDNPVFNFLGDKKRIRAKRLRNVYSEGILVEAPPGMKEGDSVIDYYGIKKYEPPEEGEEHYNLSFKNKGINAEKEPDWWKEARLGKYDIEPLRKYGHLLNDGEDVVITTKLHGSNSFFRYHEERLWCRSRNYFKRFDELDMWWQIAINYKLGDKLKNHSRYGFYGEIYGMNKGFRYDAELIDNKAVPKFRVFDVYDFENKNFLEHKEAFQLVKDIGLDYVPVLYEGPWKADRSLYALAEEDETLTGSLSTPNAVREGFVVKPKHNRFEHAVGGRVVLKYVSERYNLQKK